MNCQTTVTYFAREWDEFSEPCDKVVVMKITFLDNAGKRTTTHKCKRHGNLLIKQFEKIKSAYTVENI